MPERSSGPHGRLPGWLRAGAAAAGRTSPAERDLVRRLEALPAGPAPDPTFRAELRAQLVAVAARLVEEGPLEGTLATPTEDGARETARVRRRLRLPRPAIVLASAAAVLIVLLGSAVYLSRGSLPGDALYSLKRANEDVRLSVTRGDESRGKKYLSYSTRRAREVDALTRRVTATALGSGPSAGGGLSAATSQLIVQTLRAGDSDARQGAKLVSEHAVGDVSAAPLAFVLDWSRTQRADLSRSMARLPAGPARTAAAQSIAVVTGIAGRVGALRGQIGCSCLTTVTEDELGPLPCSKCPSTSSPQTTAPTQSAPGRGPSSSPSRPSSSRPGGRGASSARPSTPPRTTANGNGGNGGNGGGGNNTPTTPPRTRVPTTPGTPTCVLVVCLPTTPTLPTLPLPTLPTLPTGNVPTIQFPTLGGNSPNSPYPPNGRQGGGAVDPAHR